MTRLLSLFGLMRVSEHELSIEQIDAFHAERYRLATAEIASLRPDAEAMRRKRQMDRDRRRMGK